MPLATLSAIIDATGISAPSYQDILNSLIESFQSIYGSDVLLTPDTQDYQWLALLALAFHDCNDTAIAVYNGFRPTFAQGAGLSSLVKINGLSRNVATNSTVDVEVVGVAGTSIENGVVQDQAGNLWDLPVLVVIPGGGTITVTATAQFVGAIQASTDTVDTIYTPTLGWQSVTNAGAATPGAPVETDAALRIRQAKSTALQAVTPLQSILAAVENVTGVQRSTLYENDTNAPDANGVPGHSISLVVLGGLDADIAQVIEQKKSPGTGTYGTTLVIVEDPSGLPIGINFFRLTQVPIYVIVTVKAQTGFVASTADEIKAQLVSFINALPIGDTVRYNWLLSVAGLTGEALGLTFYITALTCGLGPGPVGVIDIPIAFNAAAESALVNIVVNIT